MSPLRFASAAGLCVALAPSTSLAPTSYRAVAGAGLLHDALRGVSGSIGLRFGGR